MAPLISYTSSSFRSPLDGIYFFPLRYKYMFNYLASLFTSVVLFFFPTHHATGTISRNPTLVTQNIHTIDPTARVEVSPIISVVPTRIPTATLTPMPTRAPYPTITPIPTQSVRIHVTLMPLGDSITFGSIAIGGYRTDLWKKLVQKDGDKIDFVGSINSGPDDLLDKDNEGLNGVTIAQLDSTVKEWIGTYQPDIVLLLIGTNDLDHGVPAVVMTQNLSKLIGDIFATKPNTYIVVSSLIFSTHGDNATWSAYNASIPGIVASYNGQGRKIVALDMSHALSGNDLADGLHPNFAGNSKMAAMWYPVVTTIYKEYMATVK